MNKVRDYYLFHIPGMIISSLTSILILAVFSNEEYGMVVIYTTWVNNFAILSFGFQDGMLLRYRKKDFKKSSKSIGRELKFAIVFQLLIFFITLAIALVVDNLALKLIVLGMLPTNLIATLKLIFQATNKIKLLGITDFVMRLTMLIGVGLVGIFQWNNINYIVFDIISKLLISILVVLYTFYLIRKYDEKPIFTENIIHIARENFKLGFSLLLGNWIIMFMYSMDKIFLSDNLVVVGIYSAAMSMLGLFIQLLIPIKSVFLANVDEKISTSKIKKLIFALNYIGFLIATCYNFIGYPIIKYLNILPEYQSSFSILRYLIVLMPMILNIQVLLNNLLIVKLHKKYPFINFFSMLMFAGVYLSAFKIIPNLIVAVIFAIVLNYILLYFINVFFLVPMKKIIFEILILGVWIFFYLMTVFNGKITLIYIIIMIFVSYKAITIFKTRLEE